MKDIYVDGPDGSGKTPFCKLIAALSPIHEYRKYPVCQSIDDITRKFRDTINSSGAIYDRSPFGSIAWHMVNTNREIVCFI